MGASMAGALAAIALPDNREHAAAGLELRPARAGHRHVRAEPRRPDAGAAGVGPLPRARVALGARRRDGMTRTVECWTDGSGTMPGAPGGWCYILRTVRDGEQIAY